MVIVGARDRADDHHEPAFRSDDSKPETNDVRVLMTGGYGCIGSWVAKQLVEAGQEVWI